MVALATPAARDVESTTDLPVLTIHQVALRTGVPTVTLRAWERRYRVPRPARTAAGYRLYAERDVQDVIRLQKYKRDGIEPRQGAFLVSRERTIAAGDIDGRRPTAWRRRFERACLRFDEAAARAVFDEARRDLGVRDVLRRIVFPAVALLGEGRDSGVISVSQEHFASELARHMATANAGFASVQRSGPPVVAGCAPGEQHELGLLSVVCGLRNAGVRVVHLGPNVPVDSLLATVDAVGARLAIVGVTIAAHLRQWTIRADALRRQKRDVSFIWAGPGAAPDRVRGLPGVATSAIEETIEVAMKWLANDARLRRPGQSNIRPPRTARRTRAPR
jgi:methanogenic corrinoid protein MtbC1